jgi:glycosyltransferase involved in cell wall biosynthesis
MAQGSDVQKIAFVGDYFPRKCGIATFTQDIRNAVVGEYPAAMGLVVPVNDVEGGYEYPPEVRFEFHEQDLASYRRAADFLNFSDTDVVSLQHEFGIFGGLAGAHILRMLRDLRMPVVTTLHTILREPNDDQRRVMVELAELSARMVVMSQRGRMFLHEIYGVPEEKIDLIPHGIPDMSFVDPNFYKDQFGVEGKPLALTFGLLSPNKGIEYMLRAMPAVLEEFPNFAYIVLGATHPNLLREQGDTYRLSLQRMVRDLGLRKNVIFYNRFVELSELLEFIGAADIYVTPYLNPTQITSGTLAYAFGCGKAVISTPYWHAEELLADGRGVLVPFGDSAALAREICALLRDETRRHCIRKRAYLMGREMIWSQVAQLYMESFQRARQGRMTVRARSLTVGAQEERQFSLPEWRLDHLLQMTDSTGMFQHACFTIPNYGEGYCTDDNARALLLTVLLDELGMDTPQIQRVASTCAAFLNAAFDPASRRFRNFLTFDRHWTETVGSDDCLGRAVWALGACIGRSNRPSLRGWARQIFEQALPAILDTTAPRTWAFTLLGIHEYFRRFSGDRLVNQARETLTARLIELYEKTAADDWLWFEDIVTYDNATLPHALILSGRWNNNGRAMEIGLESLRWLAELHHSPHGHFRPIGCNGFYRRGAERAEFDQQPIEAHAMVSACIEAYRASEDNSWLNEMQQAFEWFLGRNDRGLEIYDSNTGGCRDGLHADRANQNEGAESTLAFLLSLAQVKLLETSLTTLPYSVDAVRPPHSYSYSRPDAGPSNGHQTCTGVSEPQVVRSGA